MLRLPPLPKIADMPATRHPQSASHSWKALRGKAEELFAAGENQSAVARRLGISRQCAHNWFWQWQRAGAGEHGTPARSNVGRQCKLDGGQLAAVDAALRQGTQRHGFAGERWTLWRVAELIERVTGVHYHSSSVWRILRALGWSLRLPPAQRRKSSGYICREWTAPVRKRF